MVTNGAACEGVAQAAATKAAPASTLVFRFRCDIYLSSCWPPGQRREGYVYYFNSRFSICKQNFQLLTSNFCKAFSGRQRRLHQSPPRPKINLVLAATTA